MKRRMPQCLNVLLRDTFAAAGARALYSMDADLDDTLAAYAQVWVTYTSCIRAPVHACQLTPWACTNSFQLTVVSTLLLCLRSEHVMFDS